jgi:hypothetical protein
MLDHDAVVAAKIGEVEQGLVGPKVEAGVAQAGTGAAQLAADKTSGS